jgi:hypothetical protein
MSAIKKDYRDSSGIMRRVLVPNDDANLSEGVPLSLDLERLYSDVPIGFVAKLSEALFNRGLIEPSDFMKPGAHELCRDAVMDVMREDALSIISLARSMLA